MRRWLTLQPLREFVRLYRDYGVREVADLTEKAQFLERRAVEERARQAARGGEEKEAWVETLRTLRESTDAVRAAIDAAEKRAASADGEAKRGGDAGGGGGGIAAQARRIAALQQEGRDLEEVRNMVTKPGKKLTVEQIGKARELVEGMIPAEGDLPVSRLARKWSKEDRADVGELFELQRGGEEAEKEADKLPGKGK